jgi:hypothetical protein
MNFTFESNVQTQICIRIIYIYYTYFYSHSNFFLLFSLLHIISKTLKCNFGLNSNLHLIIVFLLLLFYYQLHKQAKLHHDAQFSGVLC